MKPYVLGIDIGGTNTVFGIVDARGNVLPALLLKLSATPISINTLMNCTQKQLN